MFSVIFVCLSVYRALTPPHILPQPLFSIPIPPQYRALTPIPSQAEAKCTRSCQSDMFNLVQPGLHCTGPYLPADIFKLVRYTARTFSK